MAGKLMAAYKRKRKPGASSMRDAEERFAFRPLAFVLMFLVFVILFLSVAIIDAGRMKDALLDSLGSKGLNIIETVEADAREKYSLLWAEDNPLASAPIGFGGLDARFSLRESMIWSLTETAWEIDRKQQESAFSNEDLKTLADAEHLQAIGIFDAAGREITRSGEIPHHAAHLALPLFKGAGEIVTDLFDGTEGEARKGIIGLRRKQAEGAVILILDADGLRYWSSRVILQSAIEESGLRKEVVYFAVFDPSGRLLAGAGELPESDGKREDAGKETKHRATLSESASTLEIHAPLQIGGVAAGTARLGLEKTRIDALNRENRRHIFLSTGLLMTLGLLATWLIYRTQNRSLSRLQEMREKLHRSERLSSLGELAAGVAHEIRNPLNAIGMAAQRLQREYGSGVHDTDGFGKLTGVIRDEIRRLNGIIEEFLGLSRTRLSLRSGSIARLLESVIRLIREEAAGRGIRIEEEMGAADLRVHMDDDKMKQALLNIARNAMDALSDGGRIRFSIERSGRERLSLFVHDTGGGISPENLKQIFHPHFSTKDKGLGLGLPIAYEIVRAHGGDIRVSSEPGEGTEFEILLPLERNRREEP